MSPEDIPLSFKQAVMDEANAHGVTLNGEPATVCGTRLPFARVRVTSGPWRGSSFEFAWETVQHVVRTNGGRFKSACSS